MFFKRWRFGPCSFEQFGGATVRVGEDARRCVVFFGILGPKGLPFEGTDLTIEYAGTGFFVQWDGGDGLTWPYLVTARHVASALSKHESFYLRTNLKDGSASLLEMSNVRWVYPADSSVDIATIPFGINRDVADHEHLPLPDELAKFGTPNAIVCGDEINIIGLFRLHAGNKRSVPFVHCGHIAVLPDPAERIPIKDQITGEMMLSEAFLVEAHTLDGLSGSPVFIHEQIELVGPHPLNERGRFPIVRGLVKFLGLYSGSWDGAPGEILAKDRGFHGSIRVPVGMGVVVPGNKITDLLKNDPSLQEDRKRRGDAHRARRAAVFDSAIPAPPASGANPTHREDFNSLLGAAAQKREQED